MEKDKILREEGEGLGSVIKNLIAFDARQREQISAELSSREAGLRQLEAERSKINEEYMQQAHKMLDALTEKQNQKAEREIAAAKAASEKNIAELEKTAAEKSDFWIEQIYAKTIEG